MPDPTWSLITGASSGIGEVFARALAARGYHLVLVARSQEKLEVLAATLRESKGISTEVIALDLSAPGAASALARRLREHDIEIDLLVNNAGFGALGEFWTLPLDRQSGMLDLNIRALVELTYLLVPRMVEKRRGGIINVSSTASFQPLPYTAVYAASKSFVTSFSLALAEELRRHGVMVVTLCPGGTSTNFFKASEYGSRKVPGGLQPAEEVVELALHKLDHGGGLAVPRLLNKFSVFIQRFIPRSWVMEVSSGLFKPPDLH